MSPKTIVHRFHEQAVTLNDRLDYFGQTVNIAARVQTLTRLHGADILVTDEVGAQLQEAFVLEAMPAEQVKGIAEPIRTWAVRERSSLAKEAAA